MESLGTHDIIVTLGIKSRGIWHWSIHDPALRFVLCPDEVLDFASRKSILKLAISNGVDIRF